MTKLNWDRARQQKLAQKYGVEIDYTVGIDANKIPPFDCQKRRMMKRQIFGVAEDEDVVTSDFANRKQ